MQTDTGYYIKNELALIILFYLFNISSYSFRYYIEIN